MKKILLLTALILSTGIYSNINAQAPTVSAPSVSGDKDLRDTGIKTRSIDLERVNRDTNKSANNAAEKNAPTTPEDKLAAKYEEIKTDFEQIQFSQDSVIKSYQNSEKIDYVQISKSAQEINKSARRLNSNLFPALNEKTEKKSKKEEKTDDEAKSAKSLRDLIVELDNTVGSFAASPLFQNLRVVDPAVSAKAKLDLEKIIILSALLDTEAQKSASGGK